MNRDKFLNIQAGQDTDLLISEIVFGHSYEEWNRLFFNNSTLYSTRIECAWVVVDFLRSFCMMDFFVGYGDNQTVWSVLWRKKAEVLVNEVRAETAPLAICRAALLAVTQYGDAEKENK